MALDLPVTVRIRVENGEQSWYTFRDFDITDKASSEVFELSNLWSFSFLLFKEESW